MQPNKIASSQWSKTMLGGNTIILDTETTGLYSGSEIVQISVIDLTGQPLLDTLVKPRNPIPPDAIAVHGITDVMVANAPTWPEVSPQLAALIAARQPCNLVVYNAVYDRKMLHSTAEVWNMPKTDWKTLANWECAMEAYAEFYGDWNDYHGSYRWQRLTAACAQQDIPEPDAPAHSALGDCLRTLALMRKMAEVIA